MRCLRNSAVAAALVILCSCSSRNGDGAYTGVVEGTSVQVPALTGGRIVELHVDTGDSVHAGQVLAQIDTTDLSFQRKQLEASLEELDVQEEIAVTAHRRASGELEYVRQRYERLASLIEGSAVTQQVVDDACNSLQNAESACRTASQQVRTVQAKKEQVSAQLGSVNKKLHDATVTTPIDGTVTGKYYEAGEAVQQMLPICEVIGTGKVWVKIYVGETALPSVRIGQDADVHVDGLDSRLTGTVAWISPKAEFTPKQILTPEIRTSLVYAVKVVIENREGILKHGMPVEVRL